MVNKLSAGFRTITRQDIQALAIMMLIMFAIAFSYVLYQGAQEDRMNIEMVLQQQGNLTAAQRVKLIDALNDAVIILPQINSALGNLSEGQQILVTLAVDDNEDTEELKRAHNISNDAPEDQIKLEVDKTGITVNNETRLTLPQPIQ